ncbi:hypothetical protein [Cryobacterium mannosilyticum]|uniref:Uncharacterized protein n=1 Tax=Cryobacterium mannosilyticum TaxID=1259190 RepID=A0A4R8W9C7_9MICO|nr:hypothetical protein [Cryobacterium mannosilyticum]TFC02004.1 hypothetical protein E3O32_12280 [Cryobacterium mannosilyticum]
MITETMPEANTEPGTEAATKRPGRGRLIAIVVVAILLLGAGAARAWWPEQKADVRAGTTLVTAEGMAARYGIDVNLIGVTAAGGLIEFRYQVVDPDKADRMMNDTTLLPIIVVEESGATMVISRPHHAAEPQLGGTYFFLFANAHNAIHAGSQVTLVMGDARLEHIVARG